MNDADTDILESRYKPDYMILHYKKNTCITNTAMKFRFYIFSTSEIIICTNNQYENII